MLTEKSQRRRDYEAAVGVSVCDRRWAVWRGPSCRKSRIAVICGPDRPSPAIGALPQHDGEERYQPRCRPRAKRAGPQQRGLVPESRQHPLPMAGMPSIPSTSIPASWACGRAAFSDHGGKSVWLVSTGQTNRRPAVPRRRRALPHPFDDTTTLTSVVFTQFLAKWFGIYLGKLDTFGGDMNAFAHEWKTVYEYGLRPHCSSISTHIRRWEPD